MYAAAQSSGVQWWCGRECEEEETWNRRNAFGEVQFQFHFLRPSTGLPFPFFSSHFLLTSKGGKVVLWVEQCLTFSRTVMWEGTEVTTADFAVHKR